MPNAAVRIEKECYDIFMAEINRLKPRKRKQWKAYLLDKWGARTRCKYENGKIWNWSLLEKEWVEVVHDNDSRGYPGPPKSRLGRMLKAGIPRHIAFPLEIALNKATDPETTSHMNKAATDDPYR